MLNRILFFSLLASSAWAKPNFVFVLVDDMSWTGTSVKMDPLVEASKSDYYLTPQIEKMAAQGMRFSNAYAPASLCTPSRAALLTGKTPAEVHMTTPGRVTDAQPYQKLAAPAHLAELPKSEITLAEVLQKEGYATAHFGKWHLGRVSPKVHGFNVHDGATGNGCSTTADNPKDIFGITTRAMQFMTRATGPFYVELSHYAVHSPYQASP